MGKICFNKTGGDTMYNYLMRVDLSGFNPQIMPQTALKSELKRQGMAKSLLYIEHLFNDDDDLIKERAVHKAALFDGFTTWLNTEGYGNRGYNAKRFSTELKRIDIEFTRLRIGGLLKLGTKLVKDTIEAAFKSYLKEPDYKFIDINDFENIEDLDSEDDLGDMEDVDTWV